MNVFVMLDLAHLVVMWGRTRAYNGEEVMDKTWREVEVTMLGTQEVLVVVVVEIRRVIESVLDTMHGKQQ